MMRMTRLKNQQARCAKTLTTRGKENEKNRAVIVTAQLSELTHANSVSAK